MKKIIFTLVCVMAAMTSISAQDGAKNLSQGQWNHGLAIGAQWIATDLGFAQAEDKVISRTNENYTLDDLRVLYGSKNAITYSALRVGETGSAVRSLQYTLYELGYYDGSIDGDYGQTTSDAVRAFQIQNGLTPVDGVAGSNTLGRLYSSDAVPASAAEVDYGSIRLGDRGDKVVQVQDCLMQMGYLDGINGVYDEATMDAVKAFQRDNGLTADGVAGSRTLQILFGY